MARLEFYNAEELARIVRRSAGLLGAPINMNGAPRNCQPLARYAAYCQPPARRVSDYAEVKGDGTITQAMAHKALAMLDVEPRGFGRDRPASCSKPWCTALTEAPWAWTTFCGQHWWGAGTIEEVIEPYLIQQGYLQRTPEGALPPRRPTSTWAW